MLTSRLLVLEDFGVKEVRYRRQPEYFECSVFAELEVDCQSLGSLSHCPCPIPRQQCTRTVDRMKMGLRIEALSISKLILF